MSVGRQQLISYIRNVFYFITWGFFKSIFAIKAQIKIAKKNDKYLHAIIMTGGMGDIVASDPAIRLVTVAGEHMIVLARSSYSSLLEFNPGIDATVRVESYCEAILLKKIFKSIRWTNLHVDGHQCNMFRIKIKNKNKSDITALNYYNNRTLADVYSIIATGQRATDSPFVYPDIKFDSKNFLKGAFGNEKPTLVVHTRATEMIRSLPKEETRELIESILGLENMNVLELGLDPLLGWSDSVYSVRDELTLAQQIKIIKDASIFLGVDSGFSHVALALKTPSVMLLGEYKNFQNYLPWQLNANAIIIRADGSLKNIDIEKIIQSILGLLKLRA